MAITIAVMGLFALVSLTIARRTKEIGIRKVIGASVANIISLIHFEYVWLLVIGVCIANATGYFLNQMLLDSVFYYNSGVTAWTLIGANGIVLLIFIITISSKVWKVATGNPIESLRYE
jgi:putative ABC transport system permease protein